MNTSARRAYIALAVTLATFATVAFAATFQYFSPATGILKGNASTYVTTAATSSDITATFSGTCNSTTFLRGDGSCSTPSGSVSSVGLTMPSGFSVSGSPVTSSGTLGVTTTLNGPLRGNGSGFITGNTSLTTEVSGLLPVANGGTGVGTLTGPIKGNGTSAFTTAAAADIYGLWSGTCNSTTFLRGDGSCQAAGGGSVTSVTGGTGISASPNPIVSSGTLTVDQAFSPTWTGTHTFSTNTTVYSTAASSFNPMYWCANGLASGSRCWGFRIGGGADLQLAVANDSGVTGNTAIDVSRSGTAVTDILFGNTTNNPTFTFSGSGATAFGGGTIINSNSATNFNPLAVCANGQASGSRCWGMRIGGGGDLQIAVANDSGTPGNAAIDISRSGTAVTDITFGNATNNPTFTFSGTGTAAMSGNLTVGGSSVCRQDGTNCPVSQTTTTATGTATGCTTSPTTTIRFVKTVNQVTFSSDGFTACTSNATTLTLTGAVPAGYQTTRTQQGETICTDSGSTKNCHWVITASSSTITLRLDSTSGDFTSSGSKGWEAAGATGSYILN